MNEMLFFSIGELNPNLKVQSLQKSPLQLTTGLFLQLQLSFGVERILTSTSRKFQNSLSS